MWRRHNVAVRRGAICLTGICHSIRHSGGASSEAKAESVRRPVTERLRRDDDDFDFDDPDDFEFEDDDENDDDEFEDDDDEFEDDDESFPTEDDDDE